MVTWGVAGWGGDSSAVHDKLLDVVDIAASNGAFAALRADGKAGNRESFLYSHPPSQNRGSGISDLPSKELPVSTGSPTNKQAPSTCNAGHRNRQTIGW